MGSWVQMVGQAMDMNNNSKAILATEYVALSLETTCAFFLDLLILATYVKFSNKMDRNFILQAQSILGGDS